MKLKDRRLRFVEEYLLDLNAKQAAIRAGYSPKGAEVHGSRLLSNAKIQRAVAHRQAVIAKRLEVNAERVVRELAKVAFADAADFEECTGQTPKSLKELPPEQSAVVQEIGWTRQGRKIKLHSKTEALRDLGRHLGLFTDNLKVSGELKTSGMDLTKLSDEQLEYLRSLETVCRNGQAHA